MKKAVLVLFPALLVVANCASTRQYVALPDQSQEVADQSMGRIYVLRPTGFGGAVSIEIRDGDQVIGKTGPGGYLCWERSPGNAEIVGKAENESSVTVDVEQGMVYYILQRIQMGILMARNRLELLAQTEGQETLEKCKPPQVVQGP
jgi:hypothetical protein